MSTNDEKRFHRVCARPGCNTEFDTNREKKIYCSDSCRYETWKAQNRDADLIKKALEHYRTCPLVKENPDAPLQTTD